MTQGWKTFARVGLVTLVALLAGEIALRVRAEWQGRPPDHWDRGLRREWTWALAHLRAGSPVLGGFARYDPRLGWTMKTNLDQPGIRTNSVGMRSDREFPERRNPGTPRILLVGDSYTFGFNVEQEEALAQVLEHELLRGWEVLNFAVPGYGPDQALLMFEETGVDYRPDVAVFGFYVRGFFRLFDDFRSYAKPWFSLGDDNRLELRGVPVVSPQELYENYRSGERRVPRWSHSYLVGGVGNLIREALEDRSIRRDDERWVLMRSILRSFRDVAVANGIRPFLLIIPNRPEDFRGTVFEDLERLAREEALDLGIPHLSLAEPFMAADPESEQVHRRDRPGGHLTPWGNRLAAELLYASLRDQGLLNGTAPPDPGS